MPALLQLNQATIKFGGLTAVNAVDFTVNDGELVGLIGPNGAGKTTVFNLMTGVYQPTSGSVHFDGQPLAGLRVNEIVERGIARTFQNIRLFGSLSVFDNVRVACNLHRETAAIHSLIRLGAFQRDKPPSPSAPRNCSTSSTSAASATPPRRASPTANSAASRSSAASRPNPSSSSSTSRPQA
jgi:ABC-type branched-subunit amino acid transport system ATPase component